MKTMTQEKSIIEKIINLDTQVKTLLDVGCGSGELLMLCKEHNIRATGVDSDEYTIENLSKSGLTVAHHDSRKLDFKNEEFDYVVMQNMLHHVPNPQSAINEALRVAKRGVIASELWFDTSINSQKHSQEIDNWCKKLHQALGFFHRSYLNAGEIISFINPKLVKNIFINYELYPTACDMEYWMQDQQQYIDQLPTNHLFHWELKNLQHKMQNKFLTEPGWMIVVIQKLNNQI